MSEFIVGTISINRRGIFQDAFGQQNFTESYRITEW